MQGGTHAQTSKEQTLALSLLLFPLFESDQTVGRLGTHT